MFEDRLLPTELLQAFQDSSIVVVAAGRAHTVAVARDGKVFMSLSHTLQHTATR